MTMRSWGELGRFGILLVLCGLLLSVPAILLRPLELVSQTDRDDAIIASMTAAEVRGDPKKTSDPTIRAVYRLNDGSSVVFVRVPLYRDELELAVGIGRDGGLFEIRNVNELLPPISARPVYLRAFALSDDIKRDILDPAARIDSMRIDSLSGASFDLNRYTGALRKAAAAAKEVK